MKNKENFYRSLRHCRTALMVTAFVIFALPFYQARAATFTVLNSNDSGAGSLREAIISANALAGADVISVAGGTINLLTPLPVITDTVAIRGPGITRVELNGAATRNSSGSYGFNIQAPNCEIRSFAINRFGDGGIRVGYQGSGTTIIQNSIGLNAAENSVNCPDTANPCGNYNNGILIAGASNVMIGTSGSGGLPNAIAGNLGRGITITGATVGTTYYNGSAKIVNAFIGTDFFGNNDFGNSLDGILIADSSGNQIGDAAAASNGKNYIIGNGGNGILITGSIEHPASSNTIQNNSVGIAQGSTAAVPNNGSGIVVQSANNTIGGTSAAARNIIGGNSVNGISIATNLAKNNVISGNYIGVLADGTTSRPNQTNGIQISNRAGGNTIGSANVTPGQCDNGCNIIANNGSLTSQTARSGIYVESTAGVGNAIRGNAIFTNGSPNDLGIDLGVPGATANDANDADTGANDLQNAPMLSTASTAKVISGSLNAAAVTTYAIDFFRNLATDTSTGEARVFIGSKTVTTNGSGGVNFSYVTPVTLAAGEYVTATATVTASANNPATVGDTSELSAGQIVSVAPTSVSISGTITKGGSPLPGVTVTLSGSSSATATTDNSGQYSFANLMTAGSYTVTPSLAGNVFEPVNRSYANLTTDITNADFTATGTNNNPRTLTVVNTTAVKTQPVTVPIVLNSQGNETDLTFSLAYDTAILSSPTVVCGNDAPNCSLTVNTNVAGQIGVAISPQSAFTTGTREVIRVTFNTASTSANSTPITFTDTPAIRETSDFNANALPTTYVNGAVTFAQGLEGDVVTRPDGNGAVSSTDVSQTRRFSVGLDSYSATTNELQRADTAPLGTFGNGSVSSTDISQTRRYQIGADPLNPAQGPTAPPATLTSEKSSLTSENALAVPEGAARAVRVVNANTSAGSTVTVSINADSIGDEQVYGFSLNYNTAILSNPIVTIGSGATGGNVLYNPCTNTPQTCSPGQVGVSVDFGSGAMPAGVNRQLVTVTFNVASNAPQGTTPLTFGDRPAVREVSNSSAQVLPTTFTNGTVTIAGASAGAVSIRGKVVTPEGKGLNRVAVQLTDERGVTRTVLTNPFGYYAFADVIAGETYIVAAVSKTYTFKSQVVTVNDAVSDLILTGTRRTK